MTRERLLARRVPGALRFAVLALALFAQLSQRYSVARADGARNAGPLPLDFSVALPLPTGVSPAAIALWARGNLLVQHDDAIAPLRQGERLAIVNMDDPARPSAAIRARPPSPRSSRGRTSRGPSRSCTTPG